MTEPRNMKERLLLDSPVGSGNGQHGRTPASHEPRVRNPPFRDVRRNRRKLLSDRQERNRPIAAIRPITWSCGARAETRCPAMQRFWPSFVLVSVKGDWRDERDPEDSGDIRCRCRRLFQARWRGRRPHPGGLRALRSDLIDPTIAVHNGRVVKRTGDGALVEFRSVVDAVRCAVEVQNAMVERNAGLPPERRIDFRIGIHLGDVVEESDGDLMGDGVNIAARLEGIAEPGAVCLSEQAYWQVKGRLDLPVTDLGATRLKNIAEPVRVYSLQVGVPVVAKAAIVPKPLEAKKRSMLAPLIAGIVALIVIAGGAWYFLVGNRTAPVIAATPAPAEATHLSIVVLPFANLSGDPSQDYFADGITENLTTDLSRIRDSFVIARNTAFTFKGKNADARQIGKELGVRYVLEGSVQRDQNQVRVNAQLIDAESGGHIWAERFDRPLADLFSMQDEIVASLASQLDVELMVNEARRAARMPNPELDGPLFSGHVLVQ